MRRRTLLLATLTAPAVTRARAERPVRVSGSSLSSSVMRRLGAAFLAAGGTSVLVLPSVGSDGAVRALAAGALDLAVLSRPTAARDAASGVRSVPFATTALAFVMRDAEPPRDLTPDDIAEILWGRRTAWPDGSPLRLVRRQPSDGDWDLLATLSPALAAAVAAGRVRPGVPTYVSDGDLADAIERLPGGLGPMTLGQVAAESRPLRPVTLAGVVPDLPALRRGAWPLVKELHIAHGPAPGDAARDFLTFLGGGEAAALLAGLDHLPAFRPAV